MRLETNFGVCACVVCTLSVGCRIDHNCAIQTNRSNYYLYQIVHYSRSMRRKNGQKRRRQSEKKRREKKTAFARRVRYTHRQFQSVSWSISHVRIICCVKLDSYICLFRIRFFCVAVAVAAAAASSHLLCSFIQNFRKRMRRACVYCECASAVIRDM